MSDICRADLADRAALRLQACERQGRLRMGSRMAVGINQNCVEQTLIDQALIGIKRSSIAPRALRHPRALSRCAHA
jgi:hypothetical protein